jgi:ABC-type Na+ efflux pump permease subunit
VSRAFDFLAGAGAVALAAVIVLAPLLAIVLLAWWGVRTYRRREAQRLLGTT